MENISCSASCELPEVVCRELFGKAIPCKGYICARDGGPYLPKPMPLQLQLFLLPQAYCPAECPFCIAGRPKTAGRIDLVRLRELLEKLKDQQIVRGISISGGEPCLDMAYLNEVLNLLFHTFGQELEVSISTNGIHAEQLKDLDTLPLLDQIHISRHHYDDAVNRQLFGGWAAPSREMLSEAIHAIGFRDLIVLNCLLLRGFIDSPEQAHKMLDFALDTGAGKVAFFTPTKINSFTRDLAVSYDQVLRREDPRLLFTRSFRDFDACRCQDGVYVSPDGRLVEFYGKTADPHFSDYARGLSISSDGHLRVGYNGEILL